MRCAAEGRLRALLHLELPVAGAVWRRVLLEAVAHDRLLDGAYMSAVSNKVMPSSSARWIVAIASPSSAAP